MNIGLLIDILRLTAGFNIILEGIILLVLSMIHFAILQLIIYPLLII